MQVFLIWLVALLIAAIPVWWLARQNARAVPIGAFALGLFAVYALGLGVGGAGAGPRSDLGLILLLWIALMVLMTVLLLVSFFRIEGNFWNRLKWTSWSMGVWILVGGILSRANGQVGDLRVAASTDAFVKEMAREEAKIPARRAALDRTPERRQAVLDSTLAFVKGEFVASYHPVDRYLVFGDPATAPERVVIWGVITPRPAEKWTAISFYAERVHERLNRLLRERGYPAKIALGFAPSPAVDSAGGDLAYFGPDGAAVVPQYPPDYTIGSRPRPLEIPHQNQNADLKGH